MSLRITIANVKRTGAMKKYLILLFTWSSLFIEASVMVLPVLADHSSSKSPSPAENNRQAPVMLARGWDQKADIKGWWMSEKLDGVRGYWTGQKLISRSGNPFRKKLRQIESLGGEGIMLRKPNSRQVLIHRFRKLHGLHMDVGWGLRNLPGAYRLSSLPL